jgi:hypothetical protein
MRMFKAALHAIDRRYTYPGFIMVCLYGAVIWLYRHEINHPEGWLFWIVMGGFVVLCATMSNIARER